MALIVAILERAEGNAETGSAWSETAIFPNDTPISSVMQWAQEISQTTIGNTPHGRLMLTIPTYWKVEEAKDA